MKVLIISHISDSDGVTPVILSKLVFDDVTSLLVETTSSSDEVSKLISNHKFDNYDNVYITDLGLNEELCNLIENDNILKTKIKLFDHHIGNISANKYSFASVIDTDEKGNKQSATSLYYQYLLKNFDSLYLSKQSVSHFVNLVRELDTWEWAKTNNLDAKKISQLFDLYGRDYFEQHFLKLLKEKETFFFDDNELFLIDIIQREADAYIEEKKEAVIPVSILGYTAGVVFASKHRSELGNALAKHFKEQYDFIIIINVERSISYRGVKDINLNEVAKVFGGKGHLNASGSPLPMELHEKIINLIFNDKATMIND